MLHDFSLGGTEAVATRLAARWAAMGAAVTIFCGSRSGTVSSVGGAGVKVVEARPAIRRNHGSRALLADAAARYFKQNPVDLLLVPANNHWPVIRPLARLRRKPAIVLQVGATLRNRAPQGIARLKLRWMLRGVDAIVTPSLEQPGSPGGRIAGRDIHVLPLASAGDEPPFPPVGGHQLVAIARLAVDKGLDVLITALGAIPDDRVRLAIVGVGADQKRLAALVARLGLQQRVQFAGAVAHGEWLARAAALVLPSRSEVHGAAVVEALAAGRPVITTDRVPASWLIDGAEAGRVVALGDSDALAAAIATVLAAPPPDPAALADRVARYRLDAVAETYLSLFAEVIAGG